MYIKSVYRFPQKSTALSSILAASARPKLYCLFSADNKRLRTPFDPLFLVAFQVRIERRKEGQRLREGRAIQLRHQIQNGLHATRAHWAWGEQKSSRRHVMTSDDCDVIKEVWMDDDGQDLSCRSLWRQTGRRFDILRPNRA